MGQRSNERVNEMNLREDQLDDEQKEGEGKKTVRRKKKKNNAKVLMRCDVMEHLQLQALHSLHTIVDYTMFEWQSHAEWWEAGGRGRAKVIRAGGDVWDGALWWHRKSIYLSNFGLRYVE